MNIRDMLRTAKVPEELHAEAQVSLSAASAATEGLTLAKWKVRLFKAKKISKLLDWEDERLCIKHPELADWDIAPMLNITASGDHFPWKETPEGGRPDPDAWMSKDPQSAEYQEAITAERSKRYFDGNHPRSRKAREMWYRRNAGEYLAWRRGVPVDTALPVMRWAGKDGKLHVEIVRCGDAWIVNTTKHVIGRLQLEGRYGFEVDNVFTGFGGTQGWFPIAGHELRAPATWSTIPRWVK